MSETNSSEANSIMSIHEDDVNNESEAHILTQEEVDEQTRSYIAHLTKQLGEDKTAGGIDSAGLRHCSPRKPVPKGKGHYNF